MIQPCMFCLQHVGSVAIKCLIIIAISCLGDTSALCLAEANILVVIARVGTIHYLCGTLTQTLEQKIYG